VTHPEGSFIGKGAAVLLAVIFIAMCGSEKPAPPPAGPTVSLPALEVGAFGALPPGKPTTLTPAMAEKPATPDRAVNYRQVMTFLGVRLSPEQKNFLNQHRFLLIPKSATAFKGKVDLVAGDGNLYDEMLGLFDYLGGDFGPMQRRPENCRLVNPDVMLHALHKYLENSLEYLEKTELAATLRRFLANYQAKALEYKAAAATPSLAEHFELIAAQLTVPLVILENAHWPSAKELEEIASYPPKAPPADDRDTGANALKILERSKGKFSEPLFNRMAAELQLIYGARDVVPSPLYGHYFPDEEVKADYTQFTPRSHYVKSSALRSYFRAMMYLGRNSYPLGTQNGLSDALLATLVLAGPGPDGRPLLPDWRKIMEITGFFAGQPDDVGYPEWRAFLVKVLGKDQLAAGQALDPATLEKISQRLGELKGPRILSEVVISPRVLQADKEQLLKESKSFRIFGQRFTFDAWVFSRLTAGQEQAPLRLPSTPSALFVPAALGDKTARGFADQYLKRLSPPFSDAEVAQFNGRLDEVAADLKKVKDSEWFSSVGSAWLKLLTTLTTPWGRGYPLYMQGPLFPVKQIESFLGSYTELKHDTLLYAKQNYAEAGDGMEEGKPPPVPKGLVEPNLAFWENLARLVAYVESGYARHGLFKYDLEEFGVLKRFQQDVAFYASLAAKELRGVPLTEAEYEQLRTKTLTYMAEPREQNVILEDKDLRAGLIADVSTDALKGQILYEATGEPHIMLVLVGNDNKVRLALGVAFNHYEFTGPLDTRYTDADWQARVYEHKGPLPEKNFWYQSLLIE
jgi:hypothetical protein